MESVAVKQIEQLQRLKSGDEGGGNADDVTLDDEPVITKEELLRDLDEALKDLKLSMEGKLKFRPIEELFAELEREDEDV